MHQKSKICTLCRMIYLIKPLSLWMLLAVIMGTFGFLTAQFIPILGGYSILSILHLQDFLSLKNIGILLICFAFLRAIFRLIEQRCNHYIAFTLLAIIRDQVFKALRKLSPAKLEGKDKGDLVSIITADIELLEVFYAHTISPICIAGLTCTVMSIYIGSFHILLGIIALIAFICVGIFLPMLIAKRSSTLGDELRSQTGELSSYMLENIRGLDEILQFHIGQQRKDTMNLKTEYLNEKQSILNRLTGTNNAIANTLILGFDILMFLTATYLYIHSQIDFTGLLISVIALMSSFGPVIALANLGTTLLPTIASASRVLDILDENPQVEDIIGKEEIDFQGAVLQNISFSYDKEDIFKDFSANLSKNKIIGIMGQSGCGKSTMLKLLMRFWNINQGHIRISQRDIADINTSNLRDLEGYMTQDTILFKDTIANNIKIAKLNASDNEVVEACKKASLHDFIMTLPYGYDTPVGELGDTLSGGEKQRVGLARIFLHDAPFILLDEPTSNLDSLNEAIILRSLKEASKDKSIAMVTHRTSTARIADEIISMERL